MEDDNWIWFSHLPIKLTNKHWHLAFGENRWSSDTSSSAIRFDARFWHCDFRSVVFYRIHDWQFWKPSPLCISWSRLFSRVILTSPSKGTETWESDKKLVRGRITCEHTVLSGTFPRWMRSRYTSRSTMERLNNNVKTSRFIDNAL